MTIPNIATFDHGTNGFGGFEGSNCHGPCRFHTPHILPPLWEPGIAPKMNLQHLKKKLLKTGCAGKLKIAISPISNSSI